MDDIWISDFHGSEELWPDFKFEMQALFKSSESQDLLAVLDQERPQEPGVSRDEFDEKSRAIYAKLVQHTSGSAFALIQGHKLPNTLGAPEWDGVGAWKTLVNRFEPKGNRGRIMAARLKKRLHTSTLGDNEDPDIFFSKIESLTHQLNTLSPNSVTDDTLMGIVLLELPSKYDVLWIVSCSDDTLTYQELKRKIRTHYMDTIMRSALTEGKRAPVTRFNGTCNYCKRYGHTKKTCPKLK